MKKPVPAAGALAAQLATAIGHHQAGRLAEAEAIYRQVLAREPQQPTANHLLGLIRLGQGRPTDAVEYISRAVRQAPREPQFLSNLGVALKDAGRLDEAIVALSRAIALRPDMAEAHANLGITLRVAQRYDEAVAALRRAVQLKPNEAGFRFNLGNALSDAGYVAESHAAFRDALRLRPQYPMAANALARSLLMYGLPKVALEIADQVLGYQPHNAALHLRRARILEELGRLEDALAANERARELDPNLAEALFHQANLTVRHDDAAVAAMVRLVADEAMPREQRLFAGFALGQVLADRGRHEESIQAFFDANALDPRRGMVPVAKTIEYLETQIGWGERLAAEHGAPAPESTRHIFVVGLPRSGKTSVEAILSSHPEVAAGGELPILDRLAASLGRDVDSPGAGDLRELARSYRQEVAELGLGKSVIVDTRPMNFRYVDLIRTAFPDARIVWCQRPVADLAVAMFEKYFSGAGTDYSADIDELRQYLAAYERIRTEWLRRNQGAALDVDLASVGEDRAASTARLLAHCGLAWHEGCLSAPPSEPRLDDRSPEEVARNRLDHMNAWRRAAPGLWA